MSAILASSFAGAVLVLVALAMNMPGAALLVALSAMFAFVTHIPEVPHFIRLICWLIGLAIAIGVFLYLSYQFI